MKIGYYSYYPNPWKGLARKMWEHHHHIFRLINQNIESLEIFTLVKPQNKSKIKKYELFGDTSILVDGFQNIKFHFLEDDNYSSVHDVDALFLEPGRVFLMDEVFGAKNERIEKARSFLIEKIRLAMNLGIPILWYDGDADLMTEDSSNFAFLLYNMLSLNDYSKCTVIGPYEDCKGLINNFKFVPYNIDFDTLSTKINNATNREIISTYFGSNYHRNSFIKHFNDVARYGRMVVYGSSWNSKKLNGVELNKAIWLAEDEFVPYYDKSLFGLYGDNDLTGEYKHYTLRIAEYLKAGIYIVPDDREYIKEKFPGTPSISQINEIMIQDLKNNYVERVMHQRKFLQNTFDSKLYVDTYYSALLGK